MLGLYDHGFRNHASALVQAMPDLYIDVQNAASMLFRLERHGVDVGDPSLRLSTALMSGMLDAKESQREILRLGIWFDMNLRKPEDGIRFKLWKRN